MPVPRGPFPSRRHRRLGPPCLLFAALLTAPAAAQTVDLRVLAEGAPVPGVLVSLVDSGGTTVVRGLTDADGMARLRAEAGRYLLRLRVCRKVRTAARHRSGGCHRACGSCRTG